MGYRGKLDWTYEQWCEWFYAQTTEYESGVKGLEPCMLWMGRMNHEASKVRYRGGQYQPHQVSFILTHDKLPEPPLQINHRCNLHNCVNPDHLYAGTAKENGRDLSKSGNWKGNLYQQGKGPHNSLGTKRTPEQKARIAAGVKAAYERRKALEAETRRDGAPERTVRKPRAGRGDSPGQRR